MSTYGTAAENLKWVRRRRDRHDTYGWDGGGLAADAIDASILMHPEGSVLIECGRTRCVHGQRRRAGAAVSASTGKGWVTADGMLLRATTTRTQREASAGRRRENSAPDGRSRDGDAARGIGERTIRRLRRAPG